MTALHDAIQHAKEAHAAHVERSRIFPTLTPEDRETVRAMKELLAALDDALPHMVDTRRLDALETIKPSPVSLTVGHLRRPAWWVSLGGDAVGSGHTAAEALDAAEREARR